MDARRSDDSDKSLNKNEEGNSTQMLKPSSKVFQMQKSLLEDLHEKGHFPIYPFIPFLMVVLSVQLMLIYCVTFDDYQRHCAIILSHIRSEYYKLHITIALTAVIFNFSLLTAYHGFSFWQSYRRQFKKKSYVDNTALVLCIILYVLIFVLPFRFVAIHELAIFSRMLITVVQVHSFMKIHSYIRENIPKILHCDTKREDDEEPKCWQPNFKRFVYFAVAPAYIYRNSYPRTKSIDWEKCFQYFVGAVCSTVLPIISLSVLTAAELYNCQSQKSLTEFAGHTILVIISSSFALFLVSPCGIFHYSYNLWAEMVQFGDRMFYMNWWTAQSYFDIAQKWSFIMHEWLHHYVFQDCRNVLRLNKRVSAIMTFLVSAIFHDYVMSIGFGFTLPALSLGVLVYLILLPRTFERKSTAPHKRNSISKFKLWTGFSLFYFAIVVSHYWVICDRMKCSQSHEATWINAIYPRVLQC